MATEPVKLPASSDLDHYAQLSGFNLATLHPIEVSEIIEAARIGLRAVALTACNSTQTPSCIDHLKAELASCNFATDEGLIRTMCPGCQLALRLGL